MVGVEIDVVVEDSLAALELYERIFVGGIQREEVTNLKRGMNEAVFTLYGARFHLLDENADYGLERHRPGETRPLWINVAVDDIRATFGRARNAGCYEVAAINVLEDMGVTNAIFADRDGHFWMLHQIDRDVSFDERMKLLGQQMDEQTE